MILVKTRWMIPLIVSGSKTQTRRLWGVPQVRLGSVHVCKPSAREPAFTRVRITRLGQESLADITTEDALAEGYDSREEFLRHFCETHAQRRSLHKSADWWLNLRDQMLADQESGPPVWVVGFELVKD